MKYAEIEREQAKDKRNKDTPHPGGCAEKIR